MGSGVEEDSSNSGRAVNLGAYFRVAVGPAGRVVVNYFSKEMERAFYRCIYI